MYMLHFTLHVTISIHVVHIETRDNIVFKDRTLGDTDYS